MELSPGDVVNRAVGSVNQDNVYGDRDHRYAELSRLSPAELEARYLGVRAAYDALHTAVDRHDDEIRFLGAHTEADTRIEDFLDVTDRKAHDALALGQLRLERSDATPQHYVVAILNLERWIIAVGRAIEQHHRAIGIEQDEDPALLAVDRRLWAAPDQIAREFRIDITGNPAVAR